MSFKRYMPQGRSGYTLLEMGIVFTVVGIFIAAAIQGYNIYVKRKAAEITERNTYIVVTALNNYLMQQGRYPCPAPLNASRDSAEYGFAIAGNACATDAAAVAATVCGDSATADCAMFQGAYKLSGAPNTANIPLNDPRQRQVNIVPRSSTDCRRYVENPPGTWGPEDPDGAGPSNPAVDCERPVVWHGAVAFRELGVPEEVAEDGYGARLVYAVSQNLTNEQTYRKDGGAIAVVDEQNNPLVMPQGSAHFIVLSNGTDNVGAFSRQGALKRPVRASADETMDALNNPATPGKGAGTAVNLAGGPADATVGTGAYRQARTSHGQGGSLNGWFDDFIRFYSSSESPLWKVANASGTNIVDLAGGGGGAARSKVGVGFGDGVAPAGSFEVTGTSSLFADHGYRAGRICSQNNQNCFGVEQIGGDGIHCASGFVTRIRGTGSSLQLVCTDDIAMSCPAGYLLQGIDGDGVLSCEPVSSCAPITVPMCNIGGVAQNYTLPVGVQGQIHTTPVYGDSKTKTYKCNASTWVFQSEAGVCECVEVNDQIFEACTDNSIREGFWDGDAEYSFTRVCPGGVETTTPISPPEEACTCRVGTETGSRSCEEGLPQGQIDVRRDWACNAAPNNTPPDGGFWQNAPAPGSGPTLNAPGTQYVPVNPAQPQWYVSSNSCECVPGDEQRVRNCADDLAGWEGQYNQERTLDCVPGSPTTPGTYSPWTPIATLASPPPTCTCNPQVMDLPPQNCPEGQLGTVMKRKYLCCNPANDPEPALAGNQCSGVTAGAWSPEFTISSSCAVASYQWTDIGTTSSGGGGYTSSPFANQIGDPCDVGENPPGGGHLQCTQFEGGGQYRIVNCRCQ